MLTVAGAFLMTRIAPQGSMLALAILVAAAILLDFGTTANMTLGQRAIFSLGAELRGRLNGLYVAAFFIGCAVGLGIASMSLDADGPTKLYLIMAGVMLFNFMTNLGPNAQTYLLAGEVFPTEVRGMGAGFAAIYNVPLGGADSGPPSVFWSAVAQR